MKPEEIAAYIGAAAWLPAIVGMIRHQIMKPKLRLIPNSFGEIGYTSNGPIINFLMAFAVENKDLIIDGLDMVIKHQNGEERNFRWYGLGETISQTSDATGIKEIVSKDQVPLAVKIVTQNLLEKFVRFQEPRYHTGDNVASQALVSRYAFLRQRDPQSYVADLLQSQELETAVRYRQDWFCWREGRYEVTLKPTSMQEFAMVETKFSFELTAENIALLRKNLENVRDDVHQIISTGRVTQIPWQWINAQFVKAS